MAGLLLVLTDAPVIEVFSYCTRLPPPQCLTER
jgi:hypothetical protein